MKGGYNLKDNVNFPSIEEINKVLPERLLYYRNLHNLTLRQVAEKLGRTPGIVSLWERGKNTPTYIDIVKICLIYEITFPELVMVEKEDKITPSQQELELIEKYRKADKEIKFTIQKILKYTQNEKKIKK